MFYDFKYKIYLIIIIHYKNENMKYNWKVSKKL